MKADVHTYMTILKNVGLDIDLDTSDLDPTVKQTPKIHEDLKWFKMFTFLMIHNNHYCF